MMGFDEQAGRKTVMRANIFCTITYIVDLPNALALMKSIRLFHANELIIVFVSDAERVRIEKAFNFGSMNFGNIMVFGIDDLARELDYSEIYGMALRYSREELARASKPAFFKMIAALFSDAAVLYVDTSCSILHDVSCLFEKIVHSSLLLFPYLISPTRDSRYIKQIEYSEITPSIVGVNLMHEEIGSILSWWQSITRYRLGDDRLAPRFAESRTIAFIASFCRNSILDKEENDYCAYWNIHEKLISSRANITMANHSELLIFDFSSIEYGQEVSRTFGFDQIEIGSVLVLAKLFEERNCQISNFSRLVHLDPNEHFISPDGRICVPSAVKKWYRKNVDRGDRDYAINPFADERILRRISEESKSHGFIGARIESMLLMSRVRALNLVRALKRAIVSIADARGFSNKVNILMEQLLKYISTFILRLLSLSIKLLGRSIGYLDHKTHALLMSLSRHPKEIKFSINRIVDDSRSDDMNVFGFFSAAIGIGEACRGVYRAAKRLNMNINAIDLSNSKARLDEYDGIKLDRSIAPAKISWINLNADQTQEFFASAYGSFIGKSQHRIGTIYWELSAFPDAWRSIQHYYDEMWVATSFIADALAKCMNLPIHIIPPSVHISDEIKFKRSYFRLPEDRKIILMAFDGRSYVSRKNPKGVIKALRVLRQNRDALDYMLLIKAHGLDPLQVKDIECELEEIPHKIMNETLTRAEHLSLLAVCDCLVSLHRSEGLGLNLAEAMMLGKPVVATAYSGNMDYMSNTNSYLVPYDLIPVRSPGVYADGYWADPDIVACAAAIDEILNDPRQAKERGSIAKQDVTRYFDEQRIASLISMNLKKF